MKQEIRFKGLSLDRDELAAQHGELALCGGMELHDGALRPSILRGTSLGGGNVLTGKLVYVHIVAGTKYYITFFNGSLYYSREVQAGSITAWDSNQISGLNYLVPESLCVSSVGNTLCVMATASSGHEEMTGLHYILFNDGSYEYLGKKPPFLGLQFNMIPNLAPDNTTSQIDVEITVPDDPGGFIKDSDADDWVLYDRGQPESGFWQIREDYITPITEQVMAAANKLIHDVTEKGLFHAPFLIRYCYRMYDGKSFIMHSPAVLMMPAHSNELIAGVADFYRGTLAASQYRNYENKFTCNITIQPAALQAKCVDTSVFTELQKWSDIIKSVDIYITPQITRIDPSSRIKTIKNAFVGKLSEGLMNGNYDTYHAPTNKHTVDEWTYKQGELMLPLISEEEYKKNVKNAATFFKLASVTIDNLANTFGSTFSDLRIENNIASNIVTQEQMIDDYRTHNLLVPINPGESGMFVYNHRLNVYGASERLFDGFSADVMFPYMNNSSRISAVVVEFDTEDGSKRVEKSCDTPFFYEQLKDYFFYPDERATHVSFKFGQDNGYRFKMDEHTFLNGAVNAFGIIQYGSQAGGDNTIPMPNKIYTSRADNPFYFPNLVGESGINDVGTGRIVGVGVITRALSPSQVGDYSLAAFCTDGIWVMKVSDTGTYSEKHNISNEVCVNPKSICQLGQSIVFATERALDRFYESDVIPISDMLNGPIQKFDTMLPDFYAAFNTGGAYANADMKKLLDFGVPAIDYFKDGQVIYDYEAKRLLVLPASVSASSTNVVLVYSINDQSWSTMVIPATRTIIQGYPNPYYQAADGRLSVLDTPYPQKETVATYLPGIIVTRTLVFSETMDIIQGFQQLCDCANKPQLYLYGSNDQRTWTLIGNSGRDYANYLPGHPFRYFRLAMYFSIAKTERYQELVLDIVNKYAKL